MVGRKELIPLASRFLALQLFQGSVNPVGDQSRARLPSSRVLAVFYRTTDGSLKYWKMHMYVYLNLYSIYNNE